MAKTRASKMIIPIVQVLIFLAVCVHSEEELAAEEIEELPTPEAYRRPNTRTNSYDSYTEKRKALRRPSSSISQSFVSTNYEPTYEDDIGRSDLGLDRGELSASSDYGSYASESGYGHSCKSSYVNASAVALLAFLFLLNLVQDIIQQVTADNVRRRRDVDEEPESAALQFIQDGGMDGLREGIPEIVIPLMVKLSDSNSTKCIARPLCEANLELSQRYGPIGRVFATLLSNVASHAYSNMNGWAFDLAQEAAYRGRNEESCGMFELCFAKGRS